MFESPDSLRIYVLAVASELRNEGFVDQSNILEHRANLACTTGWEWLGELGLGVEKIINSGDTTNDINEKLHYILETVKSKTPYG
jgi:hypothetical protein